MAFKDIETTRQYFASYYSKHREFIKSRSKLWAKHNHSKKLAVDAQYRVDNRDKINAYFREMPKDKKQIRYKKGIKYTAARRARKLKATPKWANDFFIEEIYDLAKLREKHTGIKWHVDHIVPLKSPLVCGLHWEGNLQVIPAAENLNKGNRFWPDI